MVSFFLPGGIIFILLTLVLYFDYLNNLPSRVVELLPFIIMASSLLIGAVFKKSRLILSVLIVLIGGFALYENHMDFEVIIFILSFYFPLNFFIIYNFQDRGIFKLSIMKYLAIFILQALIYVYISKYEKVFTNNVFSLDTITNYLYEGLLLSKASLIIYISVLTYYLVDYFFKKEPLSKTFFWSLLVVAIMFCSNITLDERQIVVSTAAFVLLISFIISSYDVAYKDKLTDLPSRRSFDEFVSELRDKYTIALVDIDFFKKFNDKYGHDIGDQALKLVASRLEKIKGGGKPFRYGGEEFAIVFTGKGIEYSYKYLEELRKDIKQQEFKIRGKKRPRKKPRIPIFLSKTKHEKITVSIGVAEKNDRLKNVYEVIKVADEALYKAKKEGRNRVCQK